MAPKRFLEKGFWDEWNSGSGPRRRAATKIIKEEIAAVNEFDAQDRAS